MDVRHRSKFIPLAKNDYILQKEMKNMITFDIEAYLDCNGQMKLEHQIKQGIFIAPKLYYLRVIPQPDQKDVIVKARGIGGDL